MNRILGCCLLVVWLLTGMATAKEQPPAPVPAPRTLIESAYQTASALESYTCRLTSVTRHRGTNGRFQPVKKNVLNYAFRNPGQIRLEWLSPRRKRGQLAVYTGEVLRAAPTWMPFAVTVDPDSPTGMDDFHHPIYRSDLASLMGVVMQDMAKVTEERYEGRTAVGERTAHRVVLLTANKRVAILIDTEHSLPLAIEQYDRKTGLLFDGGYFEALRLNPSLDDSLFDL